MLRRKVHALLLALSFSALTALFIPALESAQAQIWKADLNLGTDSVYFGGFYYFQDTVCNRHQFATGYVIAYQYPGTNINGILQTDAEIQSIPNWHIIPRVHFPPSSYAFRNGLVGWAAAHNWISGVVYKTIDGGNTWQETSPHSFYTSIGYASSTDRLFVSDYDTTFYSVNEGSSWDVLFPEPHFNFAFSTPFNGIAGGFGGSYLIYTKDGGITWKHSTLVGDEYQPCAIPGTSTFFAVSEKGVDANSVFRSDDGGATWSTIYHFPLSDTLTGAIAGNLCHLFLQTTQDVFVSTDEGLSWSSTGGPGDSVETSQICSNGNFVTAAASPINLYSTAGNSYVLLYRFDIMPGVVLSQLPSFSCDTATIRTLHFSVVNDCHNSILQGATVLGSTAFRIQRVSPAPDTLFADDSLDIRYEPQSSVPDTGSLFMTFCTPGGVVDTTIPLYGRGLKSSVLSVNSTPLSTCITLDTSISFFVTGDCHEGILKGATITGSVGFELTKIPTLPDTLFADDSVLLRYQPVSSVRDTAYLNLTIQTPLGLLDTSIVLYGSASPISTIIAYNSIHATTCSTLDTAISFFVTNGCGNAVVTNISIHGSQAFQLARIPKLPDTMTVLDSALIRYSPSSILPDSAELVFTITTPNRTFDTTVLLLGAGLPPSVVVLSADSIAMRPCSQDTSISFIVRSNCDNSVLLAYTLRGSSTFVITSGPKLPQAVGTLDSVMIRYTNAGNNRDTTALNLKFQTPLGIIDTSVMLFGKIATPSLFMNLSPKVVSSSAHAGDYVTLDVNPDLKIQDQGLNAIDFNLSFNDDLLDVLNMNTAIPGATLVVTAGSVANHVRTIPIHISGNNLSFDPSQSVLTVSFKALLADSSSTPIVLDSLQLNGGDPNYRCTLSADISSTTFNLNLLCGDSTIQQFMREGNLSFIVQSITPNPTDGKLRIVLAKHDDRSVVYDLYDALGHAVRHGTFSSPTTTLDLHAVPSGSYYLRLSTQNQVESRKIILAR